MMLCIVGREFPDLYELLRREFAEEPGVRVRVDGRYGERRLAPSAWPKERRGGDRRSRPEADAHLRALGWSMVHIGL